MDDIRFVLWAFMIGVSVAALYVFFVRKKLGGFVRKLLQNNAFTPESALSMEELGEKPSFFLRRTLRIGSVFSRTVLCENDRYYIPEECVQKAESKYKANTGGVVILLVAIALFAIVTLVCVYVFPALAQSIVGLFSSES